MQSPDPAPESPPGGGAVAASGPAPVSPALEQAPEDTDAAWGDYAESDDDRLYRDRPPHWADF